MFGEVKTQLNLCVVDENEIHHYTTEGKQQSEQWVSVGGTAPKRPKTQRRRRFSEILKV